jgi:hypothetical protein
MAALADSLHSDLSDGDESVLTEYARVLYELAKAELELYIKVDNPGLDPYTQVTSDLCDDLFSFICGVDRFREAGNE